MQLMQRSARNCVKFYAMQATRGLQEKQNMFLFDACSARSGQWHHGIHHV